MPVSSCVYVPMICYQEITFIKRYELRTLKQKCELFFIPVLTVVNTKGSAFYP